MILARIKCHTGYEVWKPILSKKKEEFSFDNDTYFIKKDLLYRWKAFGIFNFNCLDYTKGIAEPVNYWQGITKKGEVDRRSISTDNKARLVKRVVRDDEYLILILIFSGLGVILSGIALYLLQQLMQRIP